MWGGAASSCALGTLPLLPLLMGGNCAYCVCCFTFVYTHKKPVSPPRGQHPRFCQKDGEKSFFLVCHTTIEQNYRQQSVHGQNYTKKRKPLSIIHHQNLEQKQQGFSDPHIAKVYTVHIVKISFTHLTFSVTKQFRKAPEREIASIWLTVSDGLLL